jgi:hypothetical protein
VKKGDSLRWLMIMSGVGLFVTGVSLKVVDGVS